MRPSRLVLAGERDLTKTAHRGIEASLALYRQAHPHFDYAWVSTAELTAESPPSVLREATGLWCTPGSPYASTAGALAAIRHARTEQKPFLGTCGGFQHALMEYARNVLRRPAEHQELNPDAERPLIAKLSCSLVGAKGRVRVTAPALFADLLGTEESIEEFHCNYGMEETLAGLFAGTALTFVAHDEVGQIRAFRLTGHPFFVGTLFQPERRALAGTLHPIVEGFLRAV